MAKYKMTVLAGNMLYVSGHGPAKITDKTPLAGKVGGDLTVEQGQESAQAVGLNILATVRKPRLAGQGEAPGQDARHGQQHAGFQGSAEGHQRLLRIDGGSVRRGRRRRRPQRRRHGIAAGQHSGGDRVSSLK